MAGRRPNFEKSSYTSIQNKWDKPPKSLAVLFLGLSATGLVIGLGLGSSAVVFYMQDAQIRVAQNDALDRLPPSRKKLEQN